MSCNHIVRSYTPSMQLNNIINTHLQCSVQCCSIKSTRFFAQPYNNTIHASMYTVVNITRLGLRLGNLYALQRAITILPTLWRAYYYGVRGKFTTRFISKIKRTMFFKFHVHYTESLPGRTRRTQNHGLAVRHAWTNVFLQWYVRLYTYDEVHFSSKNSIKKRKNMRE